MQHEIQLEMPTPPQVAAAPAAAATTAANTAATTAAGVGTGVGTSTSPTATASATKPLPPAWQPLPRLRNVHAVHGVWMLLSTIQALPTEPPAPDAGADVRERSLLGIFVAVAKEIDQYVLCPHSSEWDEVCEAIKASLRSALRHATRNKVNVDEVETAKKAFERFAVLSARFKKLRNDLVHVYDLWDLSNEVRTRAVGILKELVTKMTPCVEMTRIERLRAKITVNAT